MTAIDRIARRLVHTRLDRIAEGRLTLRESHRIAEFGSGRDPSAEITVHDPSLYRATALGGHLGAAETYVRGKWDTEDLTELARLFLRNRSVLDGLDEGLARIGTPLRRLGHWLRRNTRSGSRRNIRAHYDLGNDFFAAFLDDTMTYSCGIFPSPQTSLREASIEKYDRICRKLQLERGDHIVEIGGGWGGFAIYAASTYGCQVTTTTISQAQRRFAAERVTRAGLANRIDVVGLDYRDLRGTYDKLVSIEMIEAVGHQFFEEFFAKCATLLAPHGLAAIQAIVIQDRFYESTRDGVDFIKQHIFPGSCLPSISALAKAAAPTDLRLVHLEEIGPHYAITLRHWRQAFHAAWPQLRSMGYAEEMRRLWHFYFCYCEAGFDEGTLGDVQLLWAKPRAVLPAPFVEPWAHVRHARHTLSGPLLSQAS